jgi:hypothetical protein
VSSLAALGVAATVAAASYYIDSRFPARENFCARIGARKGQGESPGCGDYLLRCVDARPSPRVLSSLPHGGVGASRAQASGRGACACSPSRLARWTLRDRMREGPGGQGRGPGRLAPWGALSCGERPAWAGESPAVCAFGSGPHGRRPLLSHSPKRSRLGRSPWHAVGREFVATGTRCYVRSGGGVRGVSGPFTLCAVKQLSRGARRGRSGQTRPALTLRHEFAAD